MYLYLSTFPFIWPHAWSWSTEHNYVSEVSWSVFRDSHLDLFAERKLGQVHRHGRGPLVADICLVISWSHLELSLICPYVNRKSLYHFADFIISRSSFTGQGFLLCVYVSVCKISQFLTNQFHSPYNPFLWPGDVSIRFGEKRAREKGNCVGVKFCSNDKI